jgi:hypothetical protein
MDIKVQNFYFAERITFNSMKKPSLKVGILTYLTFSSFACTTYIIPVDSLRAQFSGIDSAKLVNVVVRGPVGEKYNYLANPIRTINCVDKQNNPAKLNISPSIEMRVTDTKNKKTIFYFDRIFVNKNYLYGVQSRFISSTTKTIPLNDITKIEVQDGKKNFKYIAR